VYVGEEDTGVWKFMAEPNQPTTATLLPMSTQSNPNIAYDVEGLTIYYAPDSTGYLIVSSQGNNSYAVFELQGNNKYLGNFTIGKGAIDGTSITDGIDVTHQDLGGKFKSGMFIAQDDHNTDDSGKSWPQNFKLVAWEKIAKAISQF
jgi:3-phytase